MRNRWCFFGAVLSILFVTKAGAVGFVQQVRLTASDAAAGDNFGVRVDLSSNGAVALVSAPGDDCGAGVDCGAGYVFVRSQSGWSQQAKLTASDAEIQANFGHDVALSGNGSTALLKATSSHCGGPARCGAVYVFRRTGGSWTQEARLTFATYSQIGVRTMALSEDGEKALVGDPFDCSETGGNSICGSVHVLARSGGSWIEEARLSIEEAYLFGFSVDLSKDGTTALVGLNSHHEEPSGTSVAAYVLVKSGGEWSLQQRLTTSSEIYGETYFEVTLSGDGQTALVSAPYFGFACSPDAQAEVTGLWFCGVLSSFTSSGGAWTERPFLHVGPEHYLFGFFSALSADGKVLLASGNSALAFERTGQSWLERQQLIGHAVALSEDGQMALTGNPIESCASGSGCGAVYIFGAGAAAPGIPTVSHLGLALLALLLAASGAGVLDRRRSV
jgi:FG-GAP repeat/IPTL-CTERM motif